MVLLLLLWCNTNTGFAFVLLQDRLHSLYWLTPSLNGLVVILGILTVVFRVSSHDMEKFFEGDVLAISRAVPDNLMRLIEGKSLM